MYISICVHAQLHEKQTLFVNCAKNTKIIRRKMLILIPIFVIFTWATWSQFS
jgi:hypothetical protein